MNEDEREFLLHKTMTREREEMLLEKIKSLKIKASSP